MTLLLKFKVPSFECSLNADVHKLSQVIRNLVSNALKFCKKPGIVSVEVDVIADTTRHELYDKHDTVTNQHKHSACLRSCLSTDPTKTQSVIVTDHDDSMRQYIRLAVTDNGAGISKVNMFYVVYYTCVLFIVIIFKHF